VTVCIASICKEGKALVLASDCMITSTSLSLNFEHAGKKMSPLSGCVALTAGDALAYTELFNLANIEVEKLKQPSVAEVVTKIKDCYQTIRKNEVVERILNPCGFSSIDDFYKIQRSLVPETAARIQAKIENYNHDLSIIIAGMANGNAHIYEVLNPGTSRCFDSIGFDVIGSGLPHAMNTLVGRSCNQETPLGEALLIVYEAKKMAEKAPGVGANITDMCIIDADDIYMLPRDKIDGELYSIYEKWRAGNDMTWKSEIQSFIEAIKNGD
jgi:hypothetical protein